MRAIKRVGVSGMILLLILAVIMVIELYPMLWMILSSMKAPDQFSRSMLDLPRGFYYLNYINAWTRGMFGIYARNSIIVTGGSMVIVLFFGSMIGFAIEKMRWKLSAITLNIFLSGIMVPMIVLLLPQYLIIKWMGLYDNLLSLIFVMSMVQLPVAIFIFSNFFRFMPNDVMESAVLDGCNIYQVYFQIVVPLSLNTFVTVTLCSFFIFWNEFIYANTFISSVNMKTIQVGISFFVGYFNSTEWGPIFAGLCIATLPTIILYIILNQKVMSGMIAGSVKG